ncbi:hypothetical protein [Burkholderia gladioli]|uniref:hypothetical protein n=1 Tax=Burkholderia gladioli TaxID=28095 RepID=UPI001ABA73C6|nr:hypothetical protein [Burkholderia gladioli]
MPNRIPLDPDLPEDFDNTPNEQRSKEQLDAWWDHPYGVELQDGSIEVRCLNGGAWDRSTHLGVAPDYNAACVLAEEKQAEWVKRRERPTFTFGAGAHAIVRMPQRPDENAVELATFGTAEGAAAYMREHYPDAKA